ncbi:hypothetical protein OCH239_04950 [Roseivivax halodurans JCM 10272]|uniref:DNA primase n=1 Tax=Roseivivax halodurans JCM 10272 TaxID=1449350 RepID=X7EE31_9RHOB|nr:hypothetical protein [Roseivivax halodurans]ETX14202.1 hypothetical protein OCH239_04950 [Roseivivax halodurans JCM 10272]
MKMIIAAALVAGGLSAAPALAQDEEKQTDCQAQADVVMQVVASRSDGADQAQTVEAVQSSLSDERATYAQVVPAIADWVYTLPEDQLGDAVGESWIEACLER